MKRRFNFKMRILTVVFGVVILLLGTTKSQAVLQANPTTHKSPVGKTGSAWPAAVRQMETVGQTMGLTETLSGLNATSESNHIDVHMVLPTEYKAVAILSASGYGNPGKLRDEADVLKRTTTGNSTGAYFAGNRIEWLASNGNANTKYIARAEPPTSNAGIDFRSPIWHGGVANYTQKLHGGYTSSCGLYAGFSGIFSWTCTGRDDHLTDVPYTQKNYAGRGVAVCE